MRGNSRVSCRKDGRGSQRCFLPLTTIPRNVRWSSRTPTPPARRSSRQFYIASLSHPIEAKGVLKIEADLTPHGGATEDGSLVMGLALLSASVSVCRRSSDRSWQLWPVSRSVDVSLSSAAEGSRGRLISTPRCTWRENRQVAGDIVGWSNGRRRWAHDPEASQTKQEGEGRPVSQKRLDPEQVGS